MQVRFSLFVRFGMKYLVVRYVFTTVSHRLQLYSLTRTPNTECILPLCFVLCVYDP